MDHVRHSRSLDGRLAALLAFLCLGSAVVGGQAPCQSDRAAACSPFCDDDGGMGGDCADDCRDCACCARTPALSPPVAMLRQAPTVIARPLVHEIIAVPDSAEPDDILHVPKASRA